MKVSDKERYKSYINDIVVNMDFLMQYKNFKLSNIDKKDQLAIERAFEIIGEATKRLSKSGFYEKYPEVEWSKMAKNRDFISHHYDNTEIQNLLRSINVGVSKNLNILKKIVEIENGKE